MTVSICCPVRLSVSVFTSNPACVDVVTVGGGVSGPVLSECGLSVECRCCEGGRLELGSRHGHGAYGEAPVLHQVLSSRLQSPVPGEYRTCGCARFCSVVRIA